MAFLESNLPYKVKRPTARVTLGLNLGAMHQRLAMARRGACPRGTLQVLGNELRTPPHGHHGLRMELHGVLLAGV